MNLNYIRVSTTTSTKTYTILVKDISGGENKPILCAKVSKEYDVFVQYRVIDESSYIIQLITL